MLLYPQLPSTRLTPASTVRASSTIETEQAQKHHTVVFNQPSSSASCLMLPVAISANGAIQLATPGSEGIQGLQAVTMANSGGSQQGTTVLQYAQTPDGQQILVPSNQVVVQGEHYLTFYRNIFLCPSIKSLVLCVIVFRCRRRAANIPDPHSDRLQLAASDRGHQLPRWVISVKAGRSNSEERNQARQKQASVCFVFQDLFLWNESFSFLKAFFIDDKL